MTALSGPGVRCEIKSDQMYSALFIGVLQSEFDKKNNYVINGTTALFFL